MYFFFLILHIIVGSFLGFTLGYTSNLQRKYRETFQAGVLIVFILMILLTLIQFGLWWAFICFIELFISAAIGLFIGVGKVEADN
ncbi:Hypothetical protein F387_01979 [Wohlfahrtiimonas chitiniclastica SH04]|uniref:Uncharacterized protein n=1 Tax=Wohlfahrtiimonas chitiniclastica SH04 TaxID=1261130 RepID=L8XY04_9GAMM|nr:hypothetical protein [Wohlfahrtiimonas chitiniclastica]ELV07196.1 Hypothetical protein F387_01979 [Wohlfahrtiimonas chitiniclastica SH04]